jgi:hypothetical protein
MKLKFYYKDIIRIENEKKTYTLYEFNDGVHFSGGQSVFHDREGKRPPILVFFEGRLAPLGEVQSPGRKGTIDRMWSNMDVIKSAGGNPNVSRNWMRRFSEIMDSMGKWIPLIIIGIIILFAILSSTGGH